MRRVRVGSWRDDSAGAMQVVSGPVGRERVHFEGPAAKRLDREMSAFLRWFNDDTSPASIDHVLKAGLAHLWFVTIHPFDDGNGRIARAIADLTLARSERSARRFYSMSAQIRRERNSIQQPIQHQALTLIDRNIAERLPEARLAKDHGKRPRQPRNHSIQGVTSIAPFCVVSRTASKTETTAASRAHSGRMTVRDLTRSETGRKIRWNCFGPSRTSSCDQPSKPGAAGSRPAR